jgi:hypothetical protein
VSAASLVLPVVDQPSRKLAPCSKDRAISYLVGSSNEEIVMSFRAKASAKVTAKITAIAVTVAACLLFVPAADSKVTGPALAIYLL